MSGFTANSLPKINKVCNSLFPKVVFNSFENLHVVAEPELGIIVKKHWPFSQFLHGGTGSQPYQSPFLLSPRIQNDFKFLVLHLNSPFPIDHESVKRWNQNMA